MCNKGANKNVTNTEDLIQSQRRAKELTPPGRQAIKNDQCTSEYMVLQGQGLRTILHVVLVLL